MKNSTRLNEWERQQTPKKKPYAMKSRVHETVALGECCFMPTQEFENGKYFKIFSCKYLHTLKLFV